MGTSPSNSDGSAEPPNSSTVILMLTTIGDTTWRMFVPTIGLLLAGMWLDGQFDTRPWIAVAGILIGSLIAGLLIRNQLKNVRK